MNRKHSNSGRAQGPHSQASMRGSRSPMNSQPQYGSDFGASNDTDFDYDLDGSTYGGEMGDYDTNGRIRPSKFSSDEDRSNSNTSSSHSSLGRYAGSQGDRGLNRQSSSSERFGYPSNMNSWSGNDRQFNPSRTSSRMGHSGWAQDSDLDLSGSMDSQRGHFGKGPKGYKRSDERIKEEVCETLARHPRIDASDIEVDVSNSMVTLSGTVESKDIRRAAEMAIENLSGVDEVKNEIRVKKSDAHSVSSDSAFASIASGKHSKTAASSFKGSGQNS